MSIFFRKMISFVVVQCVFIMYSFNGMAMRKVDDDFEIHITESEAIINDRNVKFETDYYNYVKLSSGLYKLENMADGIVFKYGDNIIFSLNQERIAGDVYKYTADMGNVTYEYSFSIIGNEAVLVDGSEDYESFLGSMTESQRSNFLKLEQALSKNVNIIDNSGVLPKNKRMSVWCALAIVGVVASVVSIGIAVTIAVPGAGAPIAGWAVGLCADLVGHTVSAIGLGASCL